MSPALEAVEGGGGRLFFTHAYDADARALYNHPWTDDARLRELWSGPLARLAALARETGARLLVLTPPDAHRVHADDLPGEFAPARPTVADRFAHLFRGEVETVSLLEPLRTMRPVIDPWRRTDSHWSAAGAYAAYRTLMDRLEGLGANLVQPEDFTLAWGLETGDLGAAMDPPRQAETARMLMTAPRARITADATNAQRHALRVFEIDDPALPTCVMIRDSFATELAPFLAESFRRTVMVGAEVRGFPDLIREERPDVILYERAERALPCGVIDWALTGWREHWPAPGDGPQEREADRAARSAARALDGSDLGEAVAQAREAVRLGDTPDRRLMLGRACLTAGDPDAGAEALEVALTAEPARWSFALHLGVARLGQNRMAEARDLFARVCALAPWHPRGFEHFGYACLALGDPASARPALEHAVMLGPELAGSWTWLLQALARLGEVEETRRVAERARAAGVAVDIAGPVA